MKKCSNVRVIEAVFVCLFVVIYAAGVVFVGNPDNDAWWLMATGRNIVENGRVPVTNPFVIHENFDMVVQQWMVAVANYLLYSAMGKVGLYTAVFFMLVLNLYLLWKWISYHTNNHKTKIICALFALFVWTPFLNTRPTLFSIAILLAELVVLEEYQKEKKTRTLLWLPALSVVEINLHSALWPMLFVLMLPYVCPSIFEGKAGFLRDIKKIPKYLCIVPVMAACGLANPNGFNGVAYLFKSYNRSELFLHITEMLPITTYPFGEVCMAASIVCTALYCACVYFRKVPLDKTKTYMMMGVALLAYTHIRNLWLLVFGVLPILCMLQNKKEQVSNNNPGKNWSVFSCTVVSLVMAVILAAEIATLFWKETPIPLPIAEADYLDATQKQEEVTLYADFNSGGYMQWRGYKTYIDARPELFTKAINHQADVANEYASIIYGDADCEAFLEKYHFTHLLVEKGNRMDEFAKQSPNFLKVSADDAYILYEYIGD